MNILQKLLLIYSIVSLSGCAGIISQPQENVPVEEPDGIKSTAPVENIQFQKQTDEIIPIESLNSDVMINRNDTGLGRPAVIALMDNAELEKQSGRVENAAATLERAIRLEPKNALLWSRLAEVRLLEKNWHQAYVLANKSNSLAQTNPELQRQNWQIIEQAKIAQNDKVAAELARSKIKELSNASP
ncbi:MAG: tetratricopeptide (TPR) repeat protein [Gammaproteobacteria bacterium]|jgi:tetratricopeptide (TPR) repeat protein